jgi:hypothetical protein
MEIGDYIYTEKFIGLVIEVTENDEFGIDFVSRDGRELNYNIVGIEVLEEQVATKEWYVDCDPFETTG